MDNSNAVLEQDILFDVIVRYNVADNRQEVLQIDIPAEISSLMYQYANNLTNDILNSAGPNVSSPIIRNAFSYFFVKAVDAVLIIHNEEILSFNGNALYNFDDVLNDRCSVSNYFGIYNADPKYYYIIAEKYYNEFYEIAANYKNAFLISPELALKITFLSMTALTPFAVEMAKQLIAPVN
ncbi:MAG: hypothetical protein ABRQ26_06090 [Syntrophomonadaceae bacterium]